MSPCGSAQKGPSDLPSICIVFGTPLLLFGPYMIQSTCAAPRTFSVKPHLPRPRSTISWRNCALLGELWRERSTISKAARLFGKRHEQRDLWGLDLICACRRCMSQIIPTRSRTSVIRAATGEVWKDGLEGCTRKPHRKPNRLMLAGNGLSQEGRCAC